MSLTDDWSDSDIAAYLTFCGVCQVPLEVGITVWANESDNKTTAHNPNGHASGLNQLMPQTARGLGYDTTTDPYLAGYREFTPAGQLAWVTKYYQPHAGGLGSVGRLYVATFLPALLEHGDDMAFELCALAGPYSWAYRANLGFDRTGKGSIVVQDLVDAANRAVGPRTRELLARIGAAQ